jgi:octaprenyl-diphosphate synthase
MPVTRTEGGPHAAEPQTFLRPIEVELRQIEEVLAAELDSVVQTVAAVSNHILEAGGKRLRPSLVALSARACRENPDSEPVVNMGACVELIHMATLMHDDVIDGAESRRGRTTANSCWGNQISVLTGDYMLAKAFSLLARDGDVRVMQAVSRATISMTEGEISQIESRGDTNALVAYYLSVIRDKTAAFMSACCRVGAILAGAPSQDEEALARYGMDLGMAFQITDDLLDLVGDPAITGKPIGGDIRESKVTMPLILTLEKAKPADRAALESMIQGDGVSTADIEFARKLAEDTGAVEGTLQAAARYTSQAAEDLTLLPASEARTSLESLAHFVLHRRS